MRNWNTWRAIGSSESRNVSFTYFILQIYFVRKIKNVFRRKLHIIYDNLKSLTIQLFFFFSFLFLNVKIWIYCVFLNKNTDYDWKICLLLHSLSTSFKHQNSKMHTSVMKGQWRCYWNVAVLKHSSCSSERVELLGCKSLEKHSNLSKTHKHPLDLF